MKPPWTALVVQRFASMRRSALYAADLAPADRSAALLDDLAEMRADMETARSSEAWQGVGIGNITCGGPSGLLRRFWP